MRVPIPGTLGRTGMVDTAADEPHNIALKACRAWLPPRPADCHKGRLGDVGILGGSPGMAGATLLAGRAALLLGAGRVHVGMLDERLAVDGVYPELMLTTPETVLRLQPPGCLVIGPGLGRGERAQRLLFDGLQTPMPLLIDADGLNLLAATPVLQDALRERSPPTLLTPHPGEAGRLLGIEARQVQADRIGSIRTLAERHRCLVVLKGAGTLVYEAGGRLWRNTTGNAGMAAPGMGDVLSGMIAALVAQGLTPEQAAVLGVCLHGAAGDVAVEAGMGPVGLTAGEVALTARRVLNQRP
ncbi:MAG: NAD(P)H-hydrate dehydratase [Thiobacillaceae bacterium]